MSQPSIDDAFEHALQQVARVRAGGMRTRGGEPADERLDALADVLRAARGPAASMGWVDARWIGGIVREAAAWTPDDDLALLGALGRLARFRG